MDELIERMQNIFDHRPARIDLRKQFERRIWRSDETFSNYFYDKVILANKVPMPEDELTDYLIDGIPDGILRNQARIQCFKKKEDLLRAFEKISIKAPNKNTHASGSSQGATSRSDTRRKQESQPREEAKQRETEIKCYNCN